jgi:hypothetical protein
VIARLGLGRRATTHGQQAGAERGQGLVEFALLVPVFMLLLLAMLEFGFVFDHTLTLQYASREGARVGSALANGGGPLGCSSGQSPNAATVDPLIIAAVTRVLTSPGSRVTEAEIPTIRIYRADANGEQIGTLVNVWAYTPGAGPTVDGRQLDYSISSVGWSACARSNALPSHSIGVALDYTYRMQTGLGGVLGFFGGSGWASIPISDRTVMSLNPTD